MRHFTTPLEIDGNVLGQLRHRHLSRVIIFELLQTFIDSLFEGRPGGRVERRSWGWLSLCSKQLLYGVAVLLWPPTHVLLCVMKSP